MPEERQQEKDFHSYTLPEQIVIEHQYRIFMQGQIDGLTERIKVLEKKLGIKK